MIWLILIVYILEWFLYPNINDQWVFLLGSKHLIIALMAITMLQASQSKSLMIRSIMALIVIDSVIDIVKFEIWNISNQDINISYISPFIFIPWLLFSIKREYPEKIDDVNLDNVNILFSNPTTSIDVIKSLFGFPVSSICIVAGGYLWSFRRSSGMFEKSTYMKKWVNNHIVIDTRIKCNDVILCELEKILGEDRRPYVKCVWSIRHVLNLLGNKYRIKSIFDYIPGFYFMRILKE